MRASQLYSRYRKNLNWNLKTMNLKKIHEKLLQMLGTNLIDWKKSATAKNRTQSFGLTQWFEKIGCDGSQNFEMHKKSFGKIQKTKIENSEIWKFGKTGNEFGKSEIRKRIRKLNGFWKNVRKIWFNCPSLECLETIIWKLL